MKWTNNEGETIECTVEEYRELKQMHPVLERRTPEKQKRKMIFWTDEEIIILKNNLDASERSLEKLFPYRTIESIKGKIGEMKRTGVIPKKSLSKIPGRKSWVYGEEEERFIRENAPKMTVNQLAKKFIKEFHKGTNGSIRQFMWSNNISYLPDKKGRVIGTKVKDGNYAGHRDRLQWVNAKAKLYMKYYDWSWEKSLSQAHNDYRLNKKNLGVIKNQNEQKKSLPCFSLIVDVSGYESLVRDAIFNRKSIGFKDLSWIKMKEGYDWNDLLWDDFVSFFMYNSERTSSYFGVPNKFKYDGVEDCIRYNKDNVMED